LFATIIGFAAAGGWLAARAVQTFTAKKVPLVGTIGVCCLIAAWAGRIVFGKTALALSLCLGWSLLVLALVDLLAFRLPDLLTLPLAGAGLLAAQILPGEHVLDHVGAGALGYVVFWAIAFAYRRLRGKEGLGLGDAKLATAAGCWLGLEPLPSVLLLASVAGILWVLIRALFKGRQAFEQRIAFGVPLCIAIWLVWLYGPLTIALPGSN
jgi:leader peptidase (prepilin peptidase)/N-methyltransferase